MRKTPLDARTELSLKLLRSLDPNQAVVLASMRFLLKRVRAVESENYQLRRRLQLQEN